MPFRTLGLSSQPFSHLYGLSDAELAAHGVRRMTADAPHAFPDRVELRDLAPGESALLVNHLHQSADTPYRASHAIFVREGAQDAYDQTGALPEVMRRRTLSLRAFDAQGWMTDAVIVDGAQAEPAIERLLADPKAAYIQAHYAAPGCYAARIERA